MPTLLIRNARCVATFDDARRELADASVFIRDTLIEAIGPADCAAAGGRRGD
jgi:8-oxoguanine deaminase